MLEILLTTVAANTLVLVVLGFLFKSIINHFLSKDITQYKNNLEHEAKIEIDQFKSNLEKKNIRLQISYGGIFEKQANVIIEIYKYIVDFDNRIRSVLCPTEDKIKLYNEFKISYDILFNFYELNKVLLPDDLEANFEKLRRDIYIAVNKQMRIDSQLSKSYMLSDQDMEKLFNENDKAYETIEHQLPQIKQDIINKFRSLIGVKV
jgi:hypothetical protein